MNEGESQGSAQREGRGPSTSDLLPDWTAPLMVSLKGIREPRQRVAKMLECIAERDPQEVATFLNTLCKNASNHGHPLAPMHLDLVRYRHIVDQLGYDKLAAIYLCATESEMIEVKSLLRTDQFASTFDEIKPEGFVRRLESLTLGERKQLSRNIERNRMEFLLFDNNPLVIRDLLLNPKLIERDVLRIASRHQAPANVLEEILKSDRWMAHYAVRKSLIFNPNTPRSYVCGLIPHLRKDDLKLFLQSSSCDEEMAKLIRTSFLR